ncbi:P-loop containing nucleoside triphosphate hydrolase protein [Aulographum hederae CBS 113979]|uniref:P-loop containing nucleoside triphosphate hydrolase protein n=1 Tax=Aulographum hederae CBS 113979 TaxID=1176131 RepID=A0A6G1GL90_9PEZI|nr:P-loop containing nucleoside triphosphate hydrolase protein [Aulographum hederae CBS 113979]
MAEEPEESNVVAVEFYQQLLSRRVDLVGDYAGNELFMIEGDSLLLHCFSDPRLDFQNGLQLLHAAYNVEAFLNGLLRRKCNFDIVFFEEHEPLCVPPFAVADKAKYLLARAAVIRHLQVNLTAAHPEIRVQVFKNVEAPDFVQYRDAAGLYFMMCHDGAILPSLKPALIEQGARTRASSVDGEATVDGDSEDDEDFPDDFVAHAEDAKGALRNMICLFVFQGYNVALINGLEWMDTKVMTVVLEGGRRIFKKKFTYEAPNLSLTPSSEYDQGNLKSLLAWNEEKSTNLTEREILTLLTLSELITAQTLPLGIASGLLLHTALLQTTKLSSRLYPPVPSSLPAIQTFLSQFSSVACKILRSPSWNAEMSGSSCDVIDLVDGRALCAVVSTKTPSFGEVANERFNVLVQALSALLSEEVPTKPATMPNVNEPPTPPKSVMGDASNTTVMPFSNPVFDQHLTPIHLKVDAKGVPESNSSARIFKELTHWHNASRPLAPAVPVNPRAAIRAAKKNQWFMAEMLNYAASLTNAIGKTIDPETIITKGERPAVIQKKEPVAEKAQKAPKGPPKAPKKAAPKSGKAAALEAAAALQSSKADVKDAKLIKAWQAQLKEIQSEPDLGIRYGRLLRYYNDLPSKTVFDTEVQLYMIDTLLRIWARHCSEDKKSEGLPVAALMWNKLVVLSKSAGLTKSIATRIENTIKCIGYPSLDVPKPTADSPLPAPFVLDIIKGKQLLELALPKDMTALDFQLSECGPYMDRSMDSAVDSRVPFQPDGWQRKVLDAIDEKKSLLVVAPTSAGKTFISFYAMKQILEADDEGVLVYVAPTKALVNQIAAEIQARYSKSFKHGGRSVWGIHTRDYRINNPTGCQVLVTVPHILQIMLLSPSNAERKSSWSNRVKRIIFDEVHCIGQAEDGIIWEQLLLTAPCPIIALSATVGNPEEFNGWLTSTQKAAGHDMTMIQHPYRYSDLRKYIYTPPKEFAFNGLPNRPPFATPGLDAALGFSYFHPVASLVNKSRGMPDDLSLEPKDCLLLWQSMNKHQTEEFKLDKKLDPPSVLPSIVRKEDVIKWEKGLKSTLKSWMAAPKSPFEKVVDDLSKPIYQDTRPQLQISNKDNSEVTEPQPVKEDRLDSTTLPLLCELQKIDALPAILFNYDRAMCEELGRDLSETFQDAEKKWKESSPTWKKKLSDFEDWKKAEEKKPAKRPPKVNRKKKGKGGEDDGEGEILSKADQERDNASSDISPWARFNPDAPLDGYHFADNKKLLMSELDGFVWQLGRRGVDPWLVEALKRGIGIHHAGMNRKYRQVVEMLFRRGFLRVVIATGTLALGINMPCKTVVFSGDSVFLTALNFRQAAGRAGRRGFDVLGNVVFQNISTAKACRLLSSRLPDLNGHFPITTTLVLRLFTLLHESNNSKFAANIINSLLSQPRLYLGSDESRMTVLHHLRFSIEYLRRQFLLGVDGAPLNFAGMVSHLYFTENSAFAFQALLKEGYFHSLCANIDKKPETTTRILMLTLAHLFGRIPCRHANKEWLANTQNRSPSVVFLPKLPRDAELVLRQHNTETLEIFQAYVNTYVDQHIKAEDNQLPLTGITFSGADAPSPNGTNGAAEPGSPTHLPAPKIRSTFVALSGHDDTFDSIGDLCRTVRSGVFLEESVIPHVALFPTESNTPLNAYLYDFFRHGQVKALAEANGIRAGDVWFLLNDFSMVLATIVTSLANFLKLVPGAGGEVDMIEVMGSGDKYEDKRDEVLVVGQGGEKAGEEVVEEEEDGEGLGRPSWDSDDGQGLLMVLKAFQVLRRDFDEKFKGMWA